MKEQPEDIKLDLMNAIVYITEKRDDALEHFNELMKTNNYTHDCMMHDALEPVLRINLQLKTLEDCMVMLKVMSSENKSLKRINENRKKNE
ncbi:MAG: hypothetical protein WC428_00860 [Candidatus Paceibacterota bacterium]